MAPPKITLYVDVVSPFAYLGYYMLRVSALNLGFHFVIAEGPSSILCRLVSSCWA